MCKILLTVLFAALAASTASAQRIEGVVNDLARPVGVSGARVTVTHNGDVANTLYSLQQKSTESRIKGYRVRIFFDNSQMARSMAYQARNKFSELFPQTPAYVLYENPYFKVSVGNCITMEEAIILWGKVKENFDRAFVIREDIPLSTLKD